MTNQFSTPPPLRLGTPLMMQLAAKLKLNAPNAHTFLEIIAARWGTVAHLVFMFFGLATNIIVSSMLILGGSATVTDLTGMNTIAVSFFVLLLSVRMKYSCCCRAMV